MKPFRFDSTHLSDEMKTRDDHAVATGPGDRQGLPTGPMPVQFKKKKKQFPLNCVLGWAAIKSEWKWKWTLPWWVPEGTKDERPHEGWRLKGVDNLNWETQTHWHFIPRKGCGGYFFQTVLQENSVPLIFGVKIKFLMRKRSHPRNRAHAICGHYFTTSYLMLTNVLCYERKQNGPNHAVVIRCLGPFRLVSLFIDTNCRSFAYPYSLKNFCLLLGGMIFE